MQLNLPTKITFWAAVIIAVAGVLVYAVHTFAARNISYLGGVGFLLVVVAFVLLCLGLIVKGL
jgi:hypothetical protein